MDIIVGKNYYYTGVGIENWKNQIVKVLKDTGEKIGTNKDVSIYICEDENGIIKRVMASNLSLSTISYAYAYGGMRDCFPEEIERFPTFKNGKYMFEYTWGSNH